MKKNKISKFLAFLALFSIIVGIIGTGVLIIFSGNETVLEKQNTISVNDLSGFLNSINSGTILDNKSLSGDLIETMSGKTDSSNTGTINLK